MRLTILLHGLVLSAFMLVQTSLVSLHARAVTNAKTGKFGLDIVVAMLWVVAGALVLGALVAGIVFGPDGLVGFVQSHAFPELATWGAAAVILVGLNLEGWCGDRRGARRASVA
jgi:hypothetical protein